MPETADKTTNPRSAAVATDLARTAKTAKGQGADKVERVAKRFAVKDVRPGQLPSMCRAVGLETVAMRRIRIGRVPLGKLPVNEWRFVPPGTRF